MIDADKLSNAVLVVAHPDDEILWFSAVVAQVRTRVICYLDVPLQDAWIRGRRAAQSAFPLQPTEFLGITESVAFNRANWADPQPAEFGLHLDALAADNSVLPGFSARRYRDNYSLLIERLRPRLSGASVVFTHNPWGEYGHEEHVQVYRAVSTLRRELGFELWFDTYASDRSAVLMARTVSRTQFACESLPTRYDIAQPIEALYRDTGCWTWPYDDYQWFETETFALDPIELPEHRQAASRMPINFISVDFAAQQEPASDLLTRIRRRLRRTLSLRAP